MLTFVPRTSARQIIQPTGNIEVTSLTGANGTLASFAIPAGSMRANSQLTIRCDFTASATGSTINVVLNDGSATTVLTGLINNTAICRAEFRIANRNSTSAQYNAIENVINFTIAAVAQSTSTKALGGAFTLSITTTNAAADVKLQSILVELIP
jgi:hypothetical protein